MNRNIFFFFANINIQSFFLEEVFMKKSKLLFIGAALLLCAIIVTAVKTTDAHAAATGETAASDRFISVTGYGYVNVKPDIAYITIGVRTSADSAEACYAQNTGKINGIVAAIEKAGVKADDIQNTCHSLYQEYDHNKPYGSAPLYTANNMLRVTVRDMGILAEVYAKAIEAGANADCGLQFALDESKETAYAAALSKAVENAQGKAELLARSAKLTLGAAYKIAEMPCSADRVNYAAGMAETALKSNISETVRTGEIRVDARVKVKYAI